MKQNNTTSKRCQVMLPGSRWLLSGMIGVSLLAVSSLAQAQSPGGVSTDLRLWLRSDQGFTPASWADQSGNGNSYTQTNASRQPFIATQLYNFNPAVDFGTTGTDARFMALPAGGPFSADNTNATFFTMTLNRSLSGYADVLGFGGTTTGAALIQANNPALTTLGAQMVFYPYTTSPFPSSPLKADSLYLSDVAFTYNVAGINFGKNGSLANTTQKVESPYAQFNTGGSILGSQGEVRNGLIPEVIAYQSNLTEAQKQQVRTYLGVKYGVSLPHNYVASNGSTIVWNQTSHTGNKNNIAGIGHDVAGGLYQKQSRSQNANQKLIIGLGSLANSNDANTGTLSDGQYLIWGDNGMAQKPGVAFSGSGLTHRFTSVWQVQNTNAVGTVRVAWPGTSFDAIKLIVSSDSTFASGNTVTDMTTNTTTINGVVYNYADVTLADGAYFTFGILATTPGGIASLPAVWYKSENVAGNTWTDASINSIDLLSNVAGSTGPTINNGDQKHNFNTWTNKYSNVNYFNDVTGTSDVFGVWADGGGTTSASTDYGSGYYYMPLTVFGVARDTLTSGGSGLITGIDNELANASEPGFGVYGAKQRFYRFGNGAAASGDNAPINASAVYSWRPPAGGSTSPGTANLTMGLNGAYTNTLVNSRSSVAGPYVKIGFAAADWGAFPGDIQEVVWFKDSLSNADLEKVETYLSLKYGTTLAHDYVNAAGTTVYSLTTNAGYVSNIAGIAREDVNGNLYQKQSNSVNVGEKLVIGLTGLANTNDANTSTLNNGDFLIWGNNGLAYTFSEPLTGMGTPNMRLAAIWKAQNTGIGTVRVAWPTTNSSLYLLQSSSDAFTSGTTTLMSSIISINGVDYKYADVTLADGQYFTLGERNLTPGGVPAAAWYRADETSDIVLNGSNVTTWKETQGKGFDIAQTTVSKQPEYSTTTTLANFNPTVNFSGGQILNTTGFNASNKIIDRTQGGIFVSGRMTGNSVSQAGLAGFDVTMDYPGVHTSNVNSQKQMLFFTAGGPGYQGLSPDPLDENIFEPNTPFLGGSVWQNAAGSYLDATVSMLGKRAVYPASSNKLYNVNLAGTAENFYVGGDNNWGSLTGQMNEVIVFANKLSDNQIDQVESYLAIKYGITYMHGMKDYVNSTHGTVWDATVNNGYHKNIAGIARDDNGALLQKQSRSENTAQQLVIGVGNLEDLNMDNSGTLADGQFLLWGDNGEANSFADYQPTLRPAHGINLLMKSVWKVQNTGSVGTVRVAWPEGNENLTLVLSSDATFDLSDQFINMSANTVTVNGITYNYADVTLTNGEYFTFGSLIKHAPGGVFNGLSVWYRADIDATNTGAGTDVTQWTDYAKGVKASPFSTAAGTTPLPKYKDGDADYLNFNPGVNFTVADQKLGNIGMQLLTSLDFDVFAATEEGMTGTRFFNVGMNNTTMNGTNWDQPAFYTNGVLRRNNLESGAGIVMGNVSPVPYVSNQPNIMYHHFSDSTYTNGRAGSILGTKVNHSKVGEVTGGFIFGANSGAVTLGDDAGFIGSIGDLIVYGADSLTLEQRNRVDAYLAIKYGVTMDNASSYVSSKSDTVWYKDLDKSFYNNVAGLARDTTSALYQKQSRSQINNNPNKQVTIGLDSIKATNQANAGTLTEGQFLLWGDNGNTVAMTNVSSTYTDFTYNGANDNRHMTRIWKVRNTENVSDSTLIKFPQASVGTTTIPGENAGAQYVIIYASDSAITQNLVVVPLVANGTDYDIAHKFPDGVSYFTYGKVKNSVPTPITLIDFNAEKVENSAVLKWTTATEKNNRGFEVERSTKAHDWTTLGFVNSKAQNGASNTILNYNFTDSKPELGDNFYRLKQVDFDGTSTYSTIRVLQFSGSKAIKVYPNPAGDYVTITGLDGQNEIMLSNVLGQVISKTKNNNASTKQIDLKDLPASMYMITIKSESGSLSTFKIVKQ
ncbi:MAG TPA: T9SS type A sorting domain-containing protein [Edaphocola sp.]|nr:T9SS type A sorting domain-containing protein [Edaphocola sp.]